MTKTNQAPRKNRKSIFSQELPGQTYDYGYPSDEHYLKIHEHIEKAVEDICAILNHQENTPPIKSIRKSDTSSPTEGCDTHQHKNIRPAHTNKLIFKKLKNLASQINDNKINTEEILQLNTEIRLETCKSTRTNNSLTLWQFYIALAIAQNNKNKEDHAWKAIAKANFYQGLHEGLVDMNRHGLGQRAAAGGRAKAAKNPAQTPARIRAEGVIAGFMLSRMPTLGWKSYLEAAQQNINAVRTLSNSLKLNTPKDEGALEELLITLAEKYKMTSKRKH
ncbi:TPA: hypothetical protein SL480_001626 [Pseudomonas aeruginosa]|uniref:hypothetical protein n=1 Tax=Pseudomonas aeruginosa TaxID=287 RepID=UPI0029942B46|nr:hypothetical protein [Pseudomonas aeruginosa]HEJ4065560.1 hypothetical protein [Pseudomonas aeruginosa]HEJ4297098.1 hypothetical protein [Pseudomonas aeruginosa]